MNRQKTIIDNFWHAISGVSTVFVIANMLPPFGNAALRSILMAVFGMGIGLGVIFNLSMLVKNDFWRTLGEFLAVAGLYLIIVAITNQYPLTWMNIGYTIGGVLAIFVISWAVQYWYYRLLVKQVNTEIRQHQ